MENPEVANTSTKTEKKKKSKNKSSNESILHMEANVKPRRSFWRSLFKKQPKKIEDESKETVITPKLNAIFEEPKNSEDKDTIQDEIEEFKQTLKQISPSILETDPPQTPPPIAKPSQEGLLEYLSSASSTSETSAASEKVTAEPNPTEAVKDKDAYSFEYSESSETSGEGPVEEKTQDKVKFVETVEQKDADSNIVVKDLNPGEDEATGTEEESGPQQPLNPSAASEINASEENNLDPSEDMTKIPELPFVPVAEQPPNKVLQHKRSPEMVPNTDLDRKSLDEKSTGSQESSDETEVWSERLNELSGLSKSVLPTAVDVNSLDETASGYREYRLDDFFKMVLQTNDEQIIKYSVAYDPIFANFNFEYFPQNLGENETFPTDDRQKVVRKRKMMSLLHDKNKMAEYLREIEQKENDKVMSEEKTMDYMINLNNCASLTAPQNSPKQKEKNMQIPPENQHEKILYLLENTKQKLQKHIEHNNNNIDPKILNLYPENYLNMFKSEIFLEFPNERMDQSTPNIQEIKDDQPLTNDSQTDLSIATNVQKNIEKKFENIEKEIDLLFKDLLANITELKDACILNGCPVDQSELKEPFITIKPIIETTIVKPILDEILENVFQNETLLKGNFNSKPLSFISDFGEIKNEPASLQISQPFHTFTIPKITLEQNLEQNEKILNAIHDEINEYNPVSYINSTEYTPVPTENSQNNAQPPDSGPDNQILTEKQVLNAIRDEIFEYNSVSHINSTEYTPVPTESLQNNAEPPNSGPDNQILTEKQILNAIRDEIFQYNSVSHINSPEYTPVPPVSYINSTEYTPVPSDNSQSNTETPNSDPVHQKIEKQILNAIDNEIFEYNSVSYMNSSEYTPVPSENLQNNPETPNSGPVTQNLIEKQVLNTINNEISEFNPVSYTNSTEYTPAPSENIPETPNSGSVSQNLIEKQLLNTIHDEISEYNSVSYMNSTEYTPVSSENSQSNPETPKSGPVNQNLMETQLLNTINDEIFEFNPVSYTNSTEYTPVPSENLQNNPETPDSGPANQNLMEKQLLNTIHDEIFEFNPVSYTNSTEYTPVPSENLQNNPETPDSGPANQNLIEKQVLNTINDDISEYNPVSYMNSTEYTPVHSENLQSNPETPDSGPANQNFIEKQLLNTINDEILEFNPVSFTNSTEYTPVSSENVQNNPETPDSGPANQNLIEKQVINMINDEISEFNPVSSMNSTEYTPVPSDNSQNNPATPNADPVTQNLIENQEISEILVENIIENAVQNIEKDTKEIDKSKKFGLFHEKKILDEPLTSHITNFNCNNPPDVTESLKHIFFGEEPDMSDFNLIEENSPKAGPSNQETDIPQLPSVPSTPLEGSNSGGSSVGRIITILDNKFSEGTEFSTMALPEDNLSQLNLNYNNASVSSEYCKKDVELERKQPEINFFEPKITDGDTISKSIQDNLKLFQQNMIKINNTNQKTAEMLNNPALLETPEGSLSILSTITENLEGVDTASKISKNSKNSQNADRYPQYIANKDLKNPKTSDKNLKENPDKK